jgi:iron(III) transport system substrate-binding protein
MKKLSLALGAAMMLCACAAFAADKKPEDYKGTVMLYSSCDEGVQLKLKAAFEKKYPNVTMEYYFAGSGKVATKLSTELQTKAVACDVIFLASPDFYINWKNEGSLVTYKSPFAAAIPASLKDADDTYAAAYVILMGFGYSTVTCSPEEAPKTYKELTDPKWQGQFVMPDPNTAGSTKAAVWALVNDKRYGWDYFKALKANEVGLESSTGNAENRVVSAAFKAGLGCDYRMLNLVANGTPIGFNNTQDVICTCPCPIAIPKGCPNEELAKLLFDWLLDPKGGQYVMAQECNLTVANADTELPAGRLKSTEVDAIAIPVDWNEMVKGAPEMLAKFDAMFKN